MKKLWIERFATGNRLEMSHAMDNSSGKGSHDPKCPIVNVCQKCWNHKDLERRKLTVGSDEGSTLMKQIFASNADPKFEDRYWRIESLTLIENCKLKAQFETYRSELEKLGRSAEDLKDTLVFSSESERACKEIFEDGYKVGSKKRHVLGHTGNGVHLVRHYDILTRYLMYQQYSSPYVLVFKTFLGKTKPIVPRLHRDDNFVLPHSGFECHVSARNVDKDMPICEALNCSYVYLYEFDDVLSNTVKYPRQILPYAIVQLEKKTPCIPENPFLAFASAESVSNWEVKGETRRGFRFVFSNSGLKGKHKVFAKGYQSGNVGSKLKGQILEMRTKSPKPLTDPKPPLLQKMDDNSLRLSKDYNDEADTTAPPDLQKYGCSPIKSNLPRGTFVFDTDISNFVGSETIRCNPQLKLQPRVKLKRLNSNYYKKCRSDKHSINENESTVPLNLQVEELVTEKNTGTGSNNENDSTENIHKSSKIHDKTHTVPNIGRQKPLGGSAQSSSVIQKQTQPTHLNAGEDSSDSVTLRLKTKKSKFGSVKYTIDKTKERKQIKLTSSVDVNERHELSSKHLTNEDGALEKNQFEFVVQPKDQHDGLKIKIAKKGNQDKDFEKLNEKKSRDKVSDTNNLNKIYSKDKSKMPSTVTPEAGSKDNIDIQEHGNQSVMKKILSSEPEIHRNETLLSQQAVLEKSKSPVLANSAPDMLNLNPVLVSANISSLSDRNGISKTTTSSNYGMSMSVHGNPISKDDIFNLEMTSFFAKGKDIDKSERLVHQIHSPIHQTHCVNPVLRAGNDLHIPVDSNMDKDLFNEKRRSHVRDFHSLQPNETLNTTDIGVNCSGDKQTDTSAQSVNSSSKPDDKNTNNACEEKVGEKNNDSSILLHAFATVGPNEDLVEPCSTLKPWKKPSWTDMTFPSTSNYLKSSDSISKNTKGVNSDLEISTSNKECSKRSKKKESLKEKTSSTEKGAKSELKSTKKRREKTCRSKDQFIKTDGIIRVNNEVVNGKQKELFLNNKTKSIPNVVEASMSQTQHINEQGLQNGCRLKVDIKDNSSNVKIDSTTADKLRSFLSTTAAAALQSKKATSKDTGSFSDTESNSLDQTLSFIEMNITEERKLDTSTDNNKASCIPERSYSDTMVVLKQNLPLPSLTSANTSNTFSGQKSDTDRSITKEIATDMTDSNLKFPVCSRTGDFSEIHENDSQETIIGGVSSSPRYQPGFASTPTGNSNLKSFESLLANIGSSSENFPKVPNIKQEKPDFCPTSQCSESAEYNVPSSSHLLSAKDKTSIKEPNSSTGNLPSIGYNTVRIKQEPIDEELEQKLHSEIEETIQNNSNSVLKCLESSTFLPRTRQEIARGVAMLDATECRNAIVDTLKELSNVLKFLTESNGQTNTEQVALVAKKMCSVLGETKVKQEKCLANQSNNLVSLVGDSTVQVKTEPIETINTFEKNVTDNLNSEEPLSQTFQVQGLNRSDCLGTPVHERENNYEYIIKPEEEEQDSLKGSTEQYNTKEKDTISNEIVKETNKTSDTILSTSERSGIDELPQLLDVGEEPDINGFEMFGLPSKKLNRRKIIFHEDGDNTTKSQIESMEDVKPTLIPIKISTEQQVHHEEPPKLDTYTDPSLKILTEIKTEKDNDIQANRLRNKQSFNLKTGVLNKGLKDRKNMFDLKNRSIPTVTSCNAQRIPVISTRVSYPALKIRDVQRTETLSVIRRDSDQRKSNFPQFSNNIVCSEQRKSNFQQSTHNILDDVYTTVCEKLMTLKTEKEIIPNDLNEFSVNTEKAIETVVMPTMVSPTDLCQTLPLVLPETSDNISQQTSISSNNNAGKLVPDNTKPKEKSRNKNESKQVIPFNTVKRLKQHQFWKYKRGETNRKFIDYKEIFDKMRKGKLDDDHTKKSKSVKRRDDSHSKKSKSVDRRDDGHSKQSKPIEKRDDGHPIKSKSAEKHDDGPPIKSKSAEKHDDGPPIKSKSDEKKDDGHPKKSQSVEKRNDGQPKKSNSVEKINGTKTDINRTRGNASKLPFLIPSNRKAQISARGATLIEDDFVSGIGRRRPVFISRKRRRSSSSVRDNPKKPRNSFERSHNKENPKRDRSPRSSSKSSHRSSDKTQSRNSKHKSHSPSSKRSSSRNIRESTRNTDEDRATRRNYSHRNTASNNNLNNQDTCKPISRWSLTQRFPAKAVFAKSGTGYFSWRRKYQTKRIANEEYVLTDKGTLQTKAEYDRWTRFKARESLRLQIETAIKDYRRTFKDTPDDKTGDEKVASYLEFLSGKLDELKNRRNKMNPIPPKKVDTPKQQNSPARKKNNRRRRKQNKANQEKRLLDKLERSRNFHHHETLQHSSIARLSSTLASDSDSLSYKQRRHATSIEELLREHISKHCETLTKQIKQEITQEFEELANSKVDLQRNKSDKRQTSSRSRDKYPDRNETRRTKDGDRYDKDSRNHRTRYDKRDEPRRSSRERCSTSQSSDKSKEERDRRGRKDNNIDNPRERYTRQDLNDDRHSDQCRHENDDIIDGNSSSTIRELYSAYPVMVDPDRRIIDVHLLPERRIEDPYYDDKAYSNLGYYPREIDKYDFQQNFDKYQFEFDRQRQNIEHTHIALPDPIERHIDIPHALRQPHFPPFHRRQWFSGKYDKYRYHKIPLLETPKEHKTNPEAEPSDEYDATKYRQFLPPWRVNQGRDRGIAHRGFHPFYNPKPHNPKPHYQPAKLSKPFRNPATYYFYEGDKAKKLGSDKIGATNHANPLEITAELRSEEADPTSRTKGPVDVPKPVHINSGVRTTSVE